MRSHVRGSWSAVEEAANAYRLDRQQGQAQRLEVWVEAAGMAPQLEASVEKYGVPVFSSGGFDSTTIKHTTAQRYARLDTPVVVLHVGDHDPSGVANFVALSEDIQAFVEGLGGIPPTFVRVAVTEEQIAAYDLPTALPEANRQAWRVERRKDGAG